MDPSVRKSPATRLTVNLSSKVNNHRRKSDLQHSVSFALSQIDSSDLSIRITPQIGELTKHLRKLNLKASARKTVPKKYEGLVNFFNRLQFSIQVLQVRNCVPTFTSIKNLVDQLTNKNFTDTHLAQLKYIFPDEIEIDKIQDDRTGFPKHNLRVTLKSHYQNFRIRNLFLNRLFSFCKSNPEDVDVPGPTVAIDQDADTDATIVKVSFLGPLGHLVDTMNAVKDLGLDVAKQTITTEGSVVKAEFLIAQLYGTSWRKVEDPDLVENIRLTIISSLLKYHPLHVDIATHIPVKDESLNRGVDELPMPLEVRFR